MNTAEIKTQNRYYWMDFTRIIACFAVIVIHTAGASSVGNRVLNVLCHSAVPLFVMISGANFLDKDVGIKSIWRKYIIPMLISFTVWSFIYAIYTSYSYYAQFTDHVLGQEYRIEFIKTIIINTINGHYHMWYIWMTIGMYAVMFFIRKFYFACTEKQILYFLTVSFVYLCMKYAVQFPVINNLNSMVSDIRLNFVMGFIIYFVGGVFLKHKTKSMKINTYLGLAGLVGLLCNILLAIFNIQLENGDVYGYFSPFTILVSFSCFWFLSQYAASFATKNKVLILAVSSLTFPIFMMHDFGIVFFKKIFRLKEIDTWLVIPSSVVIFLGCLAVSKVLSLHPLSAKVLCNMRVTKNVRHPFSKGKEHT